jgi:hypothetical protein
MPVPAEHILFHHLHDNHYPPIPAALYPIAIEAIEACDEGDTDRQITLPKSADREFLLAWQVVEFMHLDGFIIDPEGE